MQDLDTLRTQMNFSFFFMKFSKEILPVGSTSVTMVVTESSPTVQGNVYLGLQTECKHNTQDETLNCTVPGDTPGYWSATRIYCLIV